MAAVDAMDGEQLAATWEFYPLSQQSVVCLSSGLASLATSLTACMHRLNTASCWLAPRHHAHQWCLLVCFQSRHNSTAACSNLAICVDHSTAQACVCSMTSARAADVLTIENSRSGDAMVVALAGAGYSKDLGPGVYDVHSPQVREQGSAPSALAPGQDNICF